MTREEIVAGVRDCLVDIADLKDAGVVTEEKRLIGDLGIDSLDLLALTFQLEQRFKVKISPRDIERRARLALGAVPLEVDGVYTPQALEVLQRALPEIPSGEFSPGLMTVQLPRLFRVATMVNLVERLLKEKP